MQLTLNSQRLAAELRLLNKVIPSKPAIAILSHTLLRAEQHAQFWATDLEVGLSCSCPARVSEPGATALPVVKLLALVEQFTDGDVVLTAEEDYVTIRCGAFKGRLQTMSVEEFPPPPVVEGQSHLLKSTAFLQLLARTRYCVNASAAKALMRGALLSLSGPIAAMVATDGKRLALATTNRTGDHDAQCIIPLKTLDMLDTHISEDCSVTFGERHLAFQSGKRLLISRTFEDKFPAYERIIPKDNSLVLSVSRAALLAALYRVNVIAEGTNRMVYFDIVPGSLGLSSSSAETGSADEDVPIDYNGEPIQICINGSYVIDFLTAASEGTITMALKDDKSPLLLSDGNDHIAVIMLLQRSSKE